MDDLHHQDCCGGQVLTSCTCDLLAEIERLTAAIEAHRVEMLLGDSRAGHVNSKLYAVLLGGDGG